MSAFVYANGQYHLLAGNKIVKDAALLDMKATDKIIVNGQSYNLGAATTPAIPEVPDAPTLSDMVHDNGTEPATGNKWYITPDGAGSMNGTSWGNAASASMIHAIMLQVESGDSVYFAEGDYTTDRTITLPSGVSLYGGFPSENPSWETRNAFTHQTVWTASHSGAWLASTSNVAGQLVDGFTLMNYAGTTADGDNLTFKNMTLSGGSFTTAGKLENCYVTGVTLNAGSVSSCKAVNSPAAISNAEGTDFYYASVEVSENAEDCNVYGTEESKVNCHFSRTATNCTVINCTANGSMFGSSATNCTAVNCKFSGGGQNPCLFYSKATNCTAVNCTGTGSSSSSGSIFYGPIRLENCTAVNCKNIHSVFEIEYNSSITNCTAVNCTSAGTFYSHGNNSSGTFMNCTAVNCTSTGRSIFDTYGSYDTIAFMNCTAVNCTGAGIFDTTGSITNCTAVNCMSTSTQTAYIFEHSLGGNRSITNCLSWNNSGTEFAGTKITCAGSTSDSALALTLGTDNSIAKFTNTGFAPAQRRLAPGSRQLPARRRNGGFQCYNRRGRRDTARSAGNRRIRSKTSIITHKEKIQ